MSHVSLPADSKGVMLHRATQPKGGSMYIGGGLITLILIIIILILIF